MNSNDKYITVLNITIYKQSVHIRRMHHVRWHACHLASFSELRRHCVSVDSRPMYGSLVHV